MSEEQFNVDEDGLGVDDVALPDDVIKETTYFKVTMAETGFVLFARPVDYAKFNEKVVELLLANLLTRQEKAQPKALQLKLMSERAAAWGQLSEQAEVDGKVKVTNNQILRGFIRAMEGAVRILLVDGHITVGKKEFDRYRLAATRSIRAETKNKKATPSHRDIAFWIIKHKAIGKTAPDRDYFTLLDFMRFISMQDTNMIVNRVLEEAGLMEDEEE